jgi:hypothetical protein
MQQTTLLLAAVLMLGTGACASRPKRTPEQQREFAEAAQRGAVLKGMTKDEVRTARGKPLETDYVEQLGGKLLRWTYAWDEVYFDATGVVVGVRAAYR